MLIKPSLTIRNGHPALSRFRIFVYGLAITLISLALVGLSLPAKEQSLVKQNSKNEIEKVISEQETIDFRKKIESQHQNISDEDRPLFKWPQVNYNESIAKVSLADNRTILKAVGKPIADKEEGTNQNGEPLQSYWFSKNLINYLKLDLSREFIDVAWAFDAKDPTKATAVFEDGQRITRALLGGQAGIALYEYIAKGGKLDELHLDDGTVIRNARCGQSMCRYQIQRD